VGLSFNFLHADDVGLDFIHEGRKAILFEDGANSVDVPGGEGDGHKIRLDRNARDGAGTQPHSDYQGWSVGSYSGMSSKFGSE
jgi:hypothetical protein